MTQRDPHWNEFYLKDFIHKPSSFAVYCAPFFGNGKMIIDAGCGNGRDSHYFASLGHRVTAVDLSEQAIDVVQGYAHPNITAICNDVANLNGVNVDLVYSRFALHSLLEEETEDRFLAWAAGALPQEGRLYIEARSDKGLDGEYAFGTDHKRRLINFDKLQNKLTGLGFQIVHAAESKGLAVYQKGEIIEDPWVLRFIAKR